MVLLMLTFGRYITIFATDSSKYTGIAFFSLFQSVVIFSPLKGLGLTRKETERFSVNIEDFRPRTKEGMHTGENDAATVGNVF